MDDHGFGYRSYLTSEEIIFTGRDDRIGDTLIIKTTCSLRKQMYYLHSCRNKAENK